MIEAQEEVKASILVITYHQEKSIDRAIESLLRQKCSFKWEIILADDSSPDATAKICREYAERYPELIRLMPEAPNKGLVGNYFDAFEHARGEYIGDCAGDDEWLDANRLQRQIEFLDSHPECSVCYCDVEVVESGKKAWLHSSDPIRNRFFKPHVAGYALLLASLNHLTTLPYTLSAALYRKEALEDVYRNYREVVRNEECGVEDVPILAALGYQGDGGYLPIKGYRYHIEGESVSNNLSHEKEYKFYSRILRLTKRLADHYMVPISDLKPHYSTKISHIAAQARHARDKSLIREIKEISKEWGLRLPLRARIHLLLLSLQGKR